MTTTRCPACDAALPEGAPWCTLCFTDLRAPEPEPEAEPQPEPEPVSVAASMPAAATAELVAVPLASAATPADLLGYDLLQPRPAGEAVATDELSEGGEGEVTWPCTACDARVPLELATCPTCGSSFLSAEHYAPSLRLPFVGDVAALSPAGRYALMAAGATALSGVLFLILLLLGLVF